MNNHKILKQRWDNIDKNILSFMKKNKQINKNMYKRLQNIFDSIKFKYNELNDYASISYKARLKVAINDLKAEYKLSGYVGYTLKEMISKKKLTNRDVLNSLILIEYYRQYSQQKTIEMRLFKEVVTYTYKTTQQEVIKEEKKKPRLLTVPEAYLLQLIGMAGFNGYKWYSYRDGVISYNANKLYEKVLVQLQQETEINVYSDDIMNLLNKQERAYINKKDGRDKVYEDYKSDFSGSLDSQISFLVNQTALKGMKDQGCKKVQFIAVLDEHTTDMCKSLDGQVFSIDDWNTFDRYSAEDKRNVVYHIKGLETGANLPPINNHFHYCRSTIYPYR